ncbi:MAG: hypothetical protein GTN93_27515, partial [Anaerolineae bacterium]|nr:hypothetical protein [Anaerolineae bacterium]
AELQRLHAQVGEGQILCADGVVFQPVFVQSQYVGALVARADGDPSPGPLLESVLRCLHVSLTLLLNQALETREVVTETLDRYPEINLLYCIGETIYGCLDADEIPHRVLGEVRCIIRADAGAVVLWAEPVTGTNEDGRGIAASFGADEHVRALQKAYRQVIAQASDTSQATIANLTRFPQPVDVG